MSKKHKFKNPEGLYFCTLTLVGWIDLFSRDSYRQVLVESLEFCRENKDLHVHAYVFMTNHIHLIISASGKQECWEIMRDFKSFTAKKFLKTIEDKQESRRDWLMYLFKFFAKKYKRLQEHMVWQHDNHPIELWSKEVIRNKVRYIHENPVRAKFVRNNSDWIYSSAGDYEGREGDIKVDLLDIVYTL